MRAHRLSGVAEAVYAGGGQPGDLCLLLLADHCGHRRVVGTGVHGGQKGSQVDLGRHQGGGAVVERGQSAPGRRLRGRGGLASPAIPCGAAGSHRRYRHSRAGPHDDHHGHLAHSPVRTGTTSAATLGSARWRAATARMSRRKSNSKS